MVPTGIDREKLLLQFSRLRENLRRLKEVSKDLEKSRLAVERLLQLCIEDCINIGNHLVSGLSLRIAGTYSEIFQILEKEGVISKKVGKQMKEFVRIRNKLVHVYWKVEEKEIKNCIKKSDYFSKFVKEVHKYLKGKGML